MCKYSNLLVLSHDTSQNDSVLIRFDFESFDMITQVQVNSRYPRPAKIDGNRDEIREYREMGFRFRVNDRRSSSPDAIYSSENSVFVRWPRDFVLSDSTFIG